MYSTRYFSVCLNIVFEYTRLAPADTQTGATIQFFKQQIKYIFIVDERMAFSADCNVCSNAIVQYELILGIMNTVGLFVCVCVRVCGVRASMMHALCALHPQGAIDARINGRALMQCTIYLRFSDKRRSVMRGALLPWATCSQYAANMLCR